MRIHLFILCQFVRIVFCDDQLRPAAIIPWSQYQQRLSKAKENFHQRNEKLLMSSDPTESGHSYFGSYEKQEALPKQLSTSFGNEERTSKLRSQYGNVIRPQIRGRLPAEPSDFVNQIARSRKEPSSEQTENKPLQYLESRFMNSHEEAPAPLPKIPSQQKLHPRPQQQLLSHLQDRSETRSKIPSLAIPNGVPMYAGNWENGQPHYLSDKRPMLHAANTFAGTSSFPLTNSITANDGLAPVYQTMDSNIVNSIFSQSQARPGAIPTMPQATQTQAYFEKLLADGASLEQISKLAKNLLGVGGGNGEGNGGILEAMTSAFRGGSRYLPTSSAAHDGLTQTAVAERPQQSVIEKLLSTAAVALNDSIKQKQLKDNAEQTIAEKKIDGIAMKEPSKLTTSKITKDQEISLKQLTELPEEERKILEAAILSGEIEANSPAIRSLIKDDVTEESKVEKANRLIEWIRSNRPSKSKADVVAMNDKLPYYGKYLGSFAETPNNQKHLHPSGALWAVDERRFIVSKFVFQPGSLLNENVTFWFGPNVPSDNILQDIMPSENGFYVIPEPVDMSVFVLNELPSIVAKPRENVASVKLLAGVPPIVANVTRLKRDVDELKNSTKPIELFVEGGVIKLEPGKGDVNGQDSELANSLKTSPTVIPAGFRLRQPEFDNVDRKVPQPLDWYAGFQPLMITLPESRSVMKLNWVSLRDHKRNETVAAILLPNGPLFKIPKPVQILPLSPNGLNYNISSGPIQILDMKTIRINSFSFQTDDNLVWFMMGKGIFAGINGHILPIYDEKSKSFDCQALRNYHNETIVLRLPEHMDMKENIWVSVYSKTKEISYSHFYLPFEMLVPPDLSSVSTRYFIPNATPTEFIMYSVCAYSPRVSDQCSKEKYLKT